MLEVNQLHIQLNKFMLDISFCLKPGLTILLGQNGSGKSTMLTGFTGYYNYLKETKTDIKYNDLPLSTEMYSYLPQETPRSVLSVRDFVELTSERDSTSILEELNLKTLKNHSIETLSGGEFKRAQIAQILLEDKPIILLDEIDQGLDVKYQKEIFERLKNIKDKIIIASVHHLSLLKYADHVMILKKGELLKKSSPKNITDTDLSVAFDTTVKIVHVNHIPQIIL